MFTKIVKLYFQSLKSGKTVKISTKSFKGKLTFKKLFQSKNIDFIDNGNLKEEHLGQKKLHLNKKGNPILEKHFLKIFKIQFLKQLYRLKLF